MSKRLDRLREGYAAFNRGDFDALRDLGAEEIELRNLSSAEPIRGRDAVIEWFRPDAFDEQRVDVHELREEGDLVFAAVEVYGRGAASGIEVRQPGFVIYEYSGDLVLKMTAYPTREQALAAAGMDESG